MDAGDRIGAYELERLIGRGAWSSVWRAWDRERGRHVAVKELPPGAPAVVAQSWRAAAGLSHPQVVGVQELLEHERSELLVMELMEGGSLRPWVGQVSLPQFAGL